MPAALALAALAGKVELVLATQRPDLSPALLAAQRQLKLLQERSRQERAAHGQPVAAHAHGRSLRAGAPPALGEQHPLFSATVLPDHLGWESAPLTAALRAAYQRCEKAPEATGDPSDSRPGLGQTQRRATDDERPATGFVVDDAGAREIASDQSVKVYPDIALGMLHQGQATAGRIWLLLRHLDERGCGWVDIDQARKHLTHKKSGLRVCGWRQLRNLLAQGENIFWQRQNDRIWLRSTVKVAASLDVWRLQYRPVALPLSILKQPIGAVRAHFYATFHSGRVKETNMGKEQSRPIGRRTIAEITEVNPRTQRIYEKKAGVHKQYNFALGEIATAGQEQERAWRQGRALFRLTDHEGKQGEPGVTYLAWQLPNNYAGPHCQRPRGQQKRFNQKLADLFMQGITGNGQQLVKPGGERRPRRFYGNGRLAAKAYNSGNRDIYWRSCQRPDQGDRYQLWYSLSELNP